MENNDPINEINVINDMINLDYGYISIMRPLNLITLFQHLSLIECLCFNNTVDNDFTNLYNVISLLIKENIVSIIDGKLSLLLNCTVTIDGILSIIRPYNLINLYIIMHSLKDSIKIEISKQDHLVLNINDIVHIETKYYENVLEAISNYMPISIESVKLIEMISILGYLYHEAPADIKRY